MPESKWGGLFFTFLAGALWGTISIPVRTLSGAGLSSVQIVFLRSIMTVILLGIYIFFFNKKLFKFRLIDIWCFWGTGVISVLIFNLFHFYTLTIASVSFETVMMYTAPFFVIFISALLFKEKITAKKLIASVIAFIGCALVSGIISGNEAIPKIAILTGLGAGFFYALYTIFSRFALQRNYDSLTITFYTFMFSAAGSVFFAKPISVFKIVAGNEKVIIFTLFITVINTILPYLIYNIGLKRAENGPAIIAASVEPVVATLIGVFFFNEIPDVFSVIGIILVLFAVVLLNINSKKK